MQSRVIRAGMPSKLRSCSPAKPAPGSWQPSRAGGPRDPQSCRSPEDKQHIAGETDASASQTPQCRSLQTPTLGKPVPASAGQHRAWSHSQAKAAEAGFLLIPAMLSITLCKLATQTSSQNVFQSALFSSSSRAKIQKTWCKAAYPSTCHLSIQVNGGTVVRGKKKPFRYIIKENLILLQG